MEAAATISSPRAVTCSAAANPSADVRTVIPEDSTQNQVDLRKDDQKRLKKIGALEANEKGATECEGRIWIGAFLPQSG